MCNTCGCSSGEHDHMHPGDHNHHHKSHQTTIQRVEHDLLAKNDRIAEENRRWFADRNILAVNLVSSPGAGKTTLLERTVRDLKNELTCCVIEGDQSTDLDAQRIRQAGCPVIQLNTGKGCHLDAGMVSSALEELSPPSSSIIFIENVGNLVCPALFDLGEYAKILVCSVTEGDDKPMKYPYIFRASSMLLLNKTDLLPYVKFSVSTFTSHAGQVNPELNIIELSAERGTHFDAWYTWLRNGLADVSNIHNQVSVVR